MKDENCIFCKILAGDIPSYQIYEDDDFKVILDVGPASRGHALIIPKEHYKNLYELPEELAGGRVHLAAGTLYGALNALCAKGWIIQLPAGDESRRKEYRLTEKGLHVLKSEVARLRELAENGERMLREE